jgi:hypothetical protein
MSNLQIAETILAIHLLIIAINVAGLIVIPLGAWLGWRIVRVAWLRLLHLSMLAIVVAQALAGQACILTIWQEDLNGQAAPVQPMIMHWVDRLIYWPLPFWAFTVMYAGVFLYVLALTLLVPFWGRAVS